MRSSEFVAMIPVDEEQAHRQGKKDSNTGEPKGWEMPFPKLLTQLYEKTSGRVIRADKGVPDTWPAGAVARPFVSDYYIDIMIDL